jgi:hypothetical protein
MPESSAMRLRLTKEVGQFRTKDAAGGTPADAVETAALPEKSLTIGAGKREICHALLTLGRAGKGLGFGL